MEAQASHRICPSKEAQLLIAHSRSDKSTRISDQRAAPQQLGVHSELHILTSQQNPSLGQVSSGMTMLTCSRILPDPNQDRPGYGDEAARWWVPIR